MNERMPHTLSLEGDGSIPNSTLPVLIYHGVDLASDALTLPSAPRLKPAKL